MKAHTKLYLEHYGLDISSDILCELCKHTGYVRAAVDIHHIECRGMGGTTKPEDIKNLIALCREHHEQFGDKKQYKKYLTQIHLENL